MPSHARWARAAAWGNECLVAWRSARLPAAAILPTKLSPFAFAHSEPSSPIDIKREQGDAHSGGERHAVADQESDHQAGRPPLVPRTAPQSLSVSLRLSLVKGGEIGAIVLNGVPRQAKEMLYRSAQVASVRAFIAGS